MVLLHVELGHVLGQTGGCGLLPREIVGRLLAVAQRQSGAQIEVRRLFHHVDQIGNRDFAQYLAGSMCLAHVAGEQTGVGLSHLDLTGQTFRHVNPSATSTRPSSGR